MSEFIAEAQVLIRPDTTAFRAQLVAQLAAATKGVTVPVNVVAAGGAGTTGFARLSAVQDQIKRTATETAGALDQVKKSSDRAGQSLTQLRSGAVASLASLTGLRGAVLAASGPFLAAAVGATAFLKSLQAFAELEQELNVFSVTAGATAQQMETVSNLAEELGADLTLPAVSAADAASAMTELAKAGLSVEDAMAGARGVLQLSTAAGISTGEAAQFAANELNAFGLAGDQAVRVADVLANSANAAQGSISDFGLAFKQSAAVANLVGLSLEETAAQLTILARAGLQGSDAGTSLRVAFLRLINPTKEAAAIIKQLGIDLRDVNGNLRPDVFVQFGEATQRFTPAMRDAAFATVFGADALRTVAIAAEAGRDGLAEATIAIGEQGSAAELAEARTAGFSGQLEALKSTTSTTAASLGELSTVIAGPLVVGLTGLATLLNGVIGPLAELTRLAKEKLGLTFDPASESTAELLARLRETQAAYEDLIKVGIGQEEVRSATEDAIRALENQRSTLKALGVDVSGINEVIRRLQNELVATGGFAIAGFSAAERAAQELRETIESLGDTAPQSLIDALKAIEDQIFLTAQEGGRFAERFDRSFRDAAGSVDVVSAALARLRGEIAASSDALLKAQNEGASPQTQIGILQGQKQDQEQIIANLKKDGIQPGDPSAIRAARKEINRINAEIASLQGQIESDIRAAEQDAKAKADDIAQAQADATKAFLSGFDPKRQRIENQIAQATLTESLQDNIKFNQQLAAFLKSQVEAIKDRIRRLGLQGAALKAAKAAIDKINQEIFQITLEIQQDQKARAEQIQNTLLQKIDLRIQIAQSQDNIAAEIRLRRKRLDIITKELVQLKNAGKKNTLEWLELKAQQAAELAAIKELEGETKKKDKSAEEFFFSQLQAQQGFAANLLGNLITGPTEGLVGNSAPSTPGRGVAVAANVQEARAATSPTAGLQNTTNSILERILQELRRLNGSYDSPEAIHQKKVGAGNMDNYAM